MNNNNQMQNNMNFMSTAGVRQPQTGMNPQNQNMAQFYTQNQPQNQPKTVFPQMRVRINPQNNNPMTMNQPISTNTSVQFQQQQQGMNLMQYNTMQPQMQMKMQQQSQITNQQMNVNNQANYQNQNMKSQQYNPQQSINSMNSFNTMNNAQPLQQSMQLPNNAQFMNQSQQINPQMKNNSVQMPTKKQRLYLKMTNEERGFFSNLFQLADKENKGKLIGKEAADFLKKSGLPKDILKRIWLISAQTNPQFLERDEFYIALRLVALAQNNLPITPECIINNSPLPPLPVFNLKKSLNPAELDTVFAMNEKDKEKYKMFFDKNKEYPDKISIGKSCQMWKSANVIDDTLKKIFNIVKPLKENGFLSLQEFQVCTHFVFKSMNNEIPQTLPGCLSLFLFGVVSNNQVNNPPMMNQENKTLDSLMSNMNIGLQPKNQPQPITVPQKGNIPQEQPSNIINPQLGINQNVQNIPSQNVTIPIQNVPSTQNVINEPHLRKSDEDLLLVTSLVEEIEKVLRVYNDNNARNEQLRHQVHEIRQKIQIGKDKLVRMAILINTKNEELISTQEELIKIKNDYSDVLKNKEKLQLDFEKEQERVSKIKEERERIIKSNQEELKQLELEKKRNQNKLDSSLKPSMPQQQTENQQIIEYGNQHIATENLPDDFELPSEKYQQVPQIQNQNIQIQGEQEKEQNFEFKEDDNKNENITDKNENAPQNTQSPVQPQNEMNQFGDNPQTTNPTTSMDYNFKQQDVGGFNFDGNAPVEGGNVFNPYEDPSPFDDDFKEDPKPHQNYNIENVQPIHHESNQNSFQPEINNQNQDSHPSQPQDHFSFQSPQNQTLPSFDSVVKEEAFYQAPKTDNPFETSHNPQTNIPSINPNMNFDFDDFGNTNTNQMNNAFENFGKKDDNKNINNNFKADDWDF